MSTQINGRCRKNKKTRLFLRENQLFTNTDIRGQVITHQAENIGQNKSCYDKCEQRKLCGVFECLPSCPLDLHETHRAYQTL